MPSLYSAAYDLFFVPGHAVEARFLKCGRIKTAAGYFADAKDEFERGVSEWDRKAEGLYVTLNPVKKALLARCVNRIKENPPQTTSDDDIQERRWILVDCDPARPSGISSSDNEHTQARSTAVRIRGFLLEEFAVQTVLADSGNGAHVLVPIHLPNDDEARDLVKRVLQSLDRKFSDDAVKVDLTTFNAGRITKLYGTLTKKGDHTEERPHRRSGILDIPPGFSTASRSALERIANLPPASETPLAPSAGKSPSSLMQQGFPAVSSPKAAFDLREWMSRHGIAAREETPYEGGAKWQMDCPFDASHKAPDAALYLSAEGFPRFKCSHNSCANRSWTDLRRLFEPSYDPSVWQSNARKPLGAPTAVSSANHPQSSAALTAAAPDEEWEAVPLLEFGQYSLPPFPTEAFPAWLRDMVEGVAENTQTPVDLSAMVVLSVLATACAGNAEVIAGPDWREPLNLFTLTVLPSGSRKSATFKRLVAPLRDFERSTNADRTISSTSLRERPSKGEDDSPPLCSLFVDDVTTEALAIVMAEQEGRIAVLSAEGGIFGNASGRYQDGGKRANIDVFLKGHAGDSLRVDRVKRPTIFIDRPALTLGITSQPETLEGLSATPGFRGSGFLARFLFSLPPDNVGSRKIETSRVDSAVVERYFCGVSRLLEARPEPNSEGERRPLSLSLSPDAHCSFIEIRQRIENDLRPDGALCDLRDWGSKLPGAIARIAGLLHLSQHGLTQQEISLETLMNAARVGNYAYSHALAAFGEMGADAELHRAKKVLEWIRRTKQDRFTRRALQNALQSQFPKAEMLTKPLEILCDRNFIRSEDQAAASFKPIGRPSIAYQVNPVTHTASIQKLQKVQNS